MGGLKIFSRRSSAAATSPSNDLSSNQQYQRLQEENRRLRQITARIATKIGIHIPKKPTKADSHQVDEEDYCPPPHVIMAQAHRLQKLNELVVALSQAPRVADAYKLVAQYTREIVGAARVSIALLEDPDIDNDKDKDDDNDPLFLEVYGLDGTQGALPLGMKLPIAGTQIGHVVQSKQPVRVMDTANSHYLDCQQLSKMGVAACVDVPLISSGKVFGTLNTGVTDCAVYYPEVEQMLLQISSVLASAIEKERLLEQAVQAQNRLQQEGMERIECPQCRNKRLAEKCVKATRSITS